MSLIHEFLDPSACFVARLRDATDAMGSEIKFETAAWVFTVRLADTNVRGENWTTQVKLARKMRLNRDTVRNADAAAIAAGLMVDTGRRRDRAVVFQMLPAVF